jgi:hypothetical protein
LAVSFADGLIKSPSLAYTRRQIDRYTTSTTAMTPTKATNAMSHLTSLSSLLMIPSVTDPVRDALSLASERWFMGVLVAGAFVAIGCISEVPETWASWVRWRRAMKDLLLEPEDEKSWHRPAAAIGLLVVVLGIVGETICEAYVSINETEIRAHDETVLGDTIKQAGNAKDSANAAAKDATAAGIASGVAVKASGAAGLAASSALTTATGARREADSFEKEIISAKRAAANAENRAAGVEVELSKQRERTAIAEKNLLELQEKIKPRRLTDGEAAAFVAALEKKPGGTIDFGYTLAGGDESFNFAKQFLPLFKQAGWTVRNDASIANHLDVQVIGVGILVSVPSGPDPRMPPSGYLQLTPTLKTLQEAFGTAGIKVQFISWFPGKDAPEVVIGSKPDPEP